MTAPPPPVEVMGRDVAHEAYRIRCAGRQALVPECLMTGQSLRPGARPSHQEAYEWIAAHRGRIARAVTRLQNGGAPKPPFDLITLLPLHLPENTSGVRGLAPGPAITMKDPTDAH